MDWADFGYDQFKIVMMLAMWLLGRIADVASSNCS
jgi:hypothetical protein